MCRCVVFSFARMVTPRMIFKQQAASALEQRDDTPRPDEKMSSLPSHFVSPENDLVPNPRSTMNTLPAPKRPPLVDGRSSGASTGRWASARTSAYISGASRSSTWCTTTGC